MRPSRHFIRLLAATIGSDYQFYLATSDSLLIFFCIRCHASFKDGLKGLRECVRFALIDFLLLLFDHVVLVVTCKITLLLL